MEAPTLKINEGWSIPIDGYGYTAFLAMPGTPRGHYDEEIDVVATGRRPGEAAIRRLVEAEVAANYNPDLRVKRIRRTW